MSLCETEMNFKMLLSLSFAVLSFCRACIAFPTVAWAAQWTFTGGTGETVTLDAVPRRTSASQDAAAALIPLGIRPVGYYTFGPPAKSKALPGPGLVEASEWSVTFGAR